VFEHGTPVLTEIILSSPVKSKIKRHNARSIDFEIEHFLEMLGYYIHEVYGIFHRQLPKLNKSF